MFYVFVISQQVELKLDSELEDISRSHNLSKKKKKKESVEFVGSSRSQAPRSPIPLLQNQPLYKTPISNFDQSKTRPKELPNNKMFLQN